MGGRRPRPRGSGAWLPESVVFLAKAAAEGGQELEEDAGYIAEDVEAQATAEEGGDDRVVGDFQHAVE